MAMSQQGTLYYDGYDPAWIIGTGKPPPAQTVVTNKPVLAATPLVPVQSNGIVPQVQLPHAHPYPQGPGTGKPKPRAHPLAGQGTPVPLVQSHRQKIGKSNLAPVPQSHVHVSGVGTEKSMTPYPQGIVGSNPNPYLPSPVVHLPVPVLPAIGGAAATTAPVRVVHFQDPVTAGPVVHAKGPVVVPASALRDPIIKVVMWVPLCCDACEKKWKDRLTDLEGFQGCDIERKLERVTVFGHVVPSTVLATVQKVVPRTQMWRH